MKKSLLMIAAILGSMALSAQTFTATCTITMKGTQTNTPDELFIYEIAESQANKFDNGWESTKMINDRLPSSVNVYAETSYGKLSTVALPDIKGLALPIITNETETNYVFSFSDVTGDIKIEDMLLDSVHAVSKGDYAFTAEKGKVTIADRFRIYKPFTPDEGEWYGCFMEDNKLYIYNNPYTADIVITDVTGAQVKSIIPKATPQTIDLSSLTPGNYTLNLGAGQKELVINVK